MSGPSDELRNLRSSPSSNAGYTNPLNQEREIEDETKEVYVKRIQLEINGNSIDGIEHIETKGKIFKHNVIWLTDILINF